jgi:hypothetical protein
VTDIDQLPRAGEASAGVAAGLRVGQSNSCVSGWLGAVCRSLPLESDETKSLTSRNQSLDVLRGIAVVLVVCCHYPYWHPLWFGWVGVDLFFFFQDS